MKGKEERERIVFDPTKQTHIVTPVEEKPTILEGQAKERMKERKEKKPKEPKQAVEPKSAHFPCEGKINKYLFLYLDSNVASAFGIEKGKEYPVSIDLKDGALVIKKA